MFKYLKLLMIFKMSHLSYFILYDIRYSQSHVRI